MSTSTQVEASVRCGHLNCPRCGLSIEVRPCRTTIRHCPRCVARSRVIVELFSSTLPADVLYDENSLPGVDDELAPASTSISSKQRQQGQVGDNFRQARPLALVVKRPMAISPPAIDERAASPSTAAATGHLPVLPPRRAGRAPAPTFGRQHASTKSSSRTSHREEPCHASQSCTPPGKTRVIRETRPLDEVNEAIADVEAGRVAARMVLEP